jgi:YlmC/YmxH family sporulation protein
MELELHSLNAMRNMEVIDILTGTKIGFIKDFKIDCDENKILSLILPGEIKSWFGKEEEKEILWKDIVKIGTDVILVNTNETNTTKDKVNLNNV